MLSVTSHPRNGDQNCDEMSNLNKVSDYQNTQMLAGIQRQGNSRVLIVGMFEYEPLLGVHEEGGAQASRGDGCVLFSLKHWSQNER